MCTGSKRTRCLWSALLTITVAACISLLYVYLENNDKYQTRNTGHSEGSYIREKLTEEECTPVCDTKECVTFAKFLLSNMKPKAYPCENIHTFTCGTYEEKFSTEESKSVHHDTVTNMFKILNDILKNIKADPESASGKLKIVYDSCMNLASSEKHAFPTAQHFLGDIGIPEWPNLPLDFQFLDTDIPTILGNLKARGELVFLMFVVPPREFSYDYLPFNKTYNMSIRLDVRYFDSLLKLPKKSSVFHLLKYFDLDLESVEAIWGDYKTVRNSILKLKDENCRELYQLKCIDPYKETEEESCNHSKGSCPSPYLSDHWFEKVGGGENCTQSSLACSDYNDDLTYVCKFVEVFLNNSDPSVRINKDHIIIDSGDEHFVTHIIPALKNFTDRTVANFLALNFYLSHLEELNFYFQLTKRMYFPHKRCESWKPPVKDRWRICTQWVAENMLLAVEYEFQKKYLTLQESKKIMDLFEELKSEAAEVVSRQNWLRKKDKEYLAVQNVTFSLTHLMGYQSRPQVYENSVNAYYNTFHPTAENFLHNALELRRTMSDLHRLLSPINPFLHSMKFEKQAVYYCEYIELYFGKLVPPHYVPGLPRLLNLLLFTTIAGHEIGHHIDFTIQYIIRSITEKRREKREQCLIHQYSQFKYEFVDENLDGKQYITENIGDNIYALLIDRIIERYVLARKDIVLPGFAYSTKQVLYIAVNELWCSKNEEKEELFYRLGESHSPFKLRSIGPMQNSKGFSEAFNCPEGSYMNPSTKCAILDDV